MEFALADSVYKETTDEQNHSFFHKDCQRENRDTVADDWYRFGRLLEPTLCTERRGPDPRKKPCQKHSAQLHATFRSPRSCPDCDRSRHPFSMGQGVAHGTRP